MSNSLTVEEKFQKARINLYTGDPYMGKALFLLDKPVNTSAENYKGENIPTMAVDGTRMYYNEDFVDKMTYEQFLFVVMHELLHILLMHPIRGKGKNGRVYNVAADLWINQRLVNEKDQYYKQNVKYDLMKGGLFAEDPSIVGKTVDEIYLELMEQYDNQKDQLKQQQQSGKGDSDGDDSGSGGGADGGGLEEDENEEGQGAGEGTGDASEDGEGTEDGDGEGDGEGDDVMDIDINVSDIELKYGKMSTTIREIEVDIKKGSGGMSDSEAEAKIRDILHQSADHSQMARQAGIGTSMADLQIIEVTKAPIKWYRYFDRYLRARASDETSYSNLDKNFVYRGLMIQGYDDDESGLDDIIIAIDCSGSIWSDMELFGKFWYHLDKISKKYKATGQVILWDSQVGNVIDLAKFDAKKSYELPSGGTNPECVYEYIKENKIKYSAMVFLTDGEFWGDFYSNPKEYDKRGIIWVLTDKAGSPHRKFDNFPRSKVAYLED